MSSSIPLAYLTARKESDISSIGRAGLQSGRRASVDRAPGDSHAISSSGQILDEIEDDDENTNDTISASPSPHFEEGGYGWVVTGCELFRRRGEKT